MLESLDWTEKSINRGLLKDDDYSYIQTKLISLPKEISTLIFYTNLKLKK
jgi:hypothetical protein